MASVDVVIPVYNEEHVLADSIATLRDFLRDNLPHTWRIVIADNASTDGTLAVAQRLAEEHNDVVPFHIPQKGRGRALRATWLAGEADVLTYMDVDLSTDLSFFPPLVAAIADEGYDVAIGSRPFLNLGVLQQSVHVWLCAKSIPQQTRQLQGVAGDDAGGV